MSPRQTLCALLTEQREYEEATIVYRYDLRLFPRNIWSLVGLRRCLKGKLDSLGQGSGQCEKSQQTEQRKALETELAQARAVFVLLV